MFLSDVGKAVDGAALQYNVVRVDGQKSVYVAVQKQGGDTNTIAVVNGIKDAITTLRDIPPELKAHVVFDQSVFVKQAISTVVREGGIGLVLTAIMILIFLGSFRATIAVSAFHSSLGHDRVFRAVHREPVDRQHGAERAGAGLFPADRQFRRRAGKYLPPHRTRRGSGHGGGQRRQRSGSRGSGHHAVAVVVFFPVTFLFGVSKYLFTALALAVVIALFASYFVAVTVVPLFCARFLKAVHAHGEGAGAANQSWGARFHAAFNAKFDQLLNFYERWVRKALDHPQQVLYAFGGLFLLSFLVYPFIGVSFFPRTDAGQFVINVKAPTGTRIEVTEEYVKKVEDIVHQVVPPDELNTVVSNIGLMPDLSALFTPNSGMHTAFVQVGSRKTTRSTASFI